MSDQKFDFELNFLDDFIPEEYTWDSNVAPAISVSASGHREVLGALYQGITAQAPVVVSPTALLSPCYKTKGDSFDEQENILHSNKNTTYSSTQHCQMHIVEI